MARAGAWQPTCRPAARGQRGRLPGPTGLASRFGPNHPGTAATWQPGHLLPDQQRTVQRALRQPSTDPRVAGHAPLNMADRDRVKARTSVSLRPDETMSLQAGLDVNDDRYAHSVYGLRSARGWALNLEGSYTPVETLNATFFYTHENQRSRQPTATATPPTARRRTSTASTAISGGCSRRSRWQRSNKINPCLELEHRRCATQVDTVGLPWSPKNSGCSAPSSTPSAGLNTESHAQLGTNNVHRRQLRQQPARRRRRSGGGRRPHSSSRPRRCPTVKTDTIELEADDALRAHQDRQAVRVGFSFQHMTSTDWAYDAPAGRRAHRAACRPVSRPSTTT